MNLVGRYAEPFFHQAFSFFISVSPVFPWLGFILSSTRDWD
jgi:hypothetical protein